MGRILNEVLGHESQISSLQKIVSDNRLPQTVLFCGLDGIGKKKVALGVVQSLVCERDSIACGICPSCTRLEKGQSEALLFIEAAKKTTLIKVEESRRILEFMRLKTEENRVRVIVIDGADRLNPQAANALLKSLEEPPERTYFILIASSLGSILPTIRSRVQVIRFAPLSKEILRQKTQAEDWIVSASGGSLGQVESMITGSWAEVRQMAMDFVSAALNDNYDYFHSLKDLLKDREVALFVSRWLQTVLRDGLWAKTSQDGWMNGDCEGMIRYLSQLEAESLLKMADDARLVEEGIQGNFDKTLLFENLWYGYRETMSA